MKTVIQLVVVALIFGGLSAVGTVFWQQRMGTAIVAGSDAATKDGKPATDAADGKTKDEKEEKTDESDPHSSEADPETSGHESVAPDAHQPDTSKNSPEPAPGNQKDSTDPHRRTDDHSAGGLHGEIPVAVRPQYAPASEEAGVLINQLRSRALAAKEKERRIADRQEAMKLIFDDLRADQAQTLKIRSQLMKELQQSRQAVDVAMKEVDEERDSLRKQQDDSRKATEQALKAAAEEQEKLRKQLAKANSPASDDATDSDSDRAKDRNANLKKMAVVCDNIPAETAAKIFQQLVKNKQTDDVVWLMNAMKERQTSKVLSAIAETNAGLAAELTDRLKRLKANPAPPAADAVPPPAP